MDFIPRLICCSWYRFCRRFIACEHNLKIRTCGDPAERSWTLHCLQISMQIFYSLLKSTGKICNKCGFQYAPIVHPWVNSHGMELLQVKRTFRRFLPRIGCKFFVKIQLHFASRSFEWKIHGVVHMVIRKKKINMSLFYVDFTKDSRDTD